MSDDSEAWKGEPEPSPYGSIFSAVFRPLTPEQKAAREQHEREAEAAAQIAALSLRPYCLTTPCPKCGGGERPAKVFYHEAPQDYHPCRAKGGIGEHFDRTCRVCKHLWVESVPLSRLQQGETP
jgi:hypothetical protein